MDNLDDFLHHLLLIKERYKVTNELRDFDFNMFSILGVETKEVRMHSAFIAELLDPKGSHKLGARFLDAFIDVIGLKGFDTRNAVVYPEFHIGRISPAGSTGGSIDIYIKSSAGSITIENKIYADDQDKQLLRYHNHDKETFLVYLTLEGKEPSKKSIGSLTSNQYLCISYGQTIVKWLGRCVEFSANAPFVRESINQYIMLIKKLTNQTLLKEESMDVVNEVFKNEANKKSFFYLMKNAAEIMNRFNDEVLKVAGEIATECDAELIAGDSSLLTRFGFFDIKTKHDIPLKIRFSFEWPNLGNLIFGFCGEHCPQAVQEYFQRGFQSRFGAYKFTSVWPAYSEWNEFKDWNQGGFESFLNGGFRKGLREKIVLMTEIAQGFETPKPNSGISPKSLSSSDVSISKYP